MPDNRQSHPVCDATYLRPDRSPYREVIIEFNQGCKPERELIKFLEGMSEVQKVTSAEAISVVSPPRVKVKQLKIVLKSGSQTPRACENVTSEAGRWVYEKGCTHGTPQPKL